MTTVLGILGSPRRGGNAEAMLDKALEGASQAGASCDKISLNELSIRPCQECGGCDGTAECVIRDDMDKVYRKVDSADAIILASPIFFGDITAQAKAMIDRFQSRWVRKYRLKRPALTRKKGAFLCISAMEKPDFFENARKTVKTFFTVLDIDYVGDRWCHGKSQKSDVLKDRRCLDSAFELGKRLVQR